MDRRNQITQCSNNETAGLKKRQMTLIVCIGGVGSSSRLICAEQLRRSLQDAKRVFLQKLIDALMFDESDEVGIEAVKMQIRTEMKNAFRMQVKSVVYNRRYHSCCIQKLHHEIETVQSVESSDGTALKQSATIEHYMNALQQQQLRKVELTALPYLFQHRLVKSGGQPWNKHKKEIGINNLCRWRNYRVPAYWCSWPLLQKFLHEWVRISLSDGVDNKCQSRDNLIAGSHIVCSIEHSREKTAFLVPRILGYSHKLCANTQKATDKLHSRAIRLEKEIEMLKNDLNRISLEPFAGMCVQKHEIRRANARLVFSPNSDVRRRDVFGRKSIMLSDCVA